QRVPPPARPVAHLGRALRHRNYRLFIGGQTVSLCGTWITNVATAWLVYRLTHSSAWLGAFAFASQIPTAVLAPVAGVWVDRWDRHRVLVITQICAMLQSAALAVFALSGLMTIARLMVLGSIQGLINAFDMPARQSFVVRMIDDRADLANAIAINSSMVNATRLVGPALGGVLIVAVGEGWCFTIDAISYLAVIASLLAMRVAKVPPRPRVSHVWAELVDGLRYVRRTPLISAVLLLLAWSSLVGMPYSSQMPAFAAKRLGGGPHTYTLMVGASGLGALSSALYLASRRSVVGLGSVLARAAAAFGAGLLALSFVRSPWLAAPIVMVVGAGMMLQMAGVNTIVQSLVDEDKRGRVMSLYALAFFGSQTVGALIAGAVASAVGPHVVVGVGGACCVLAAIVFRAALPALRTVSRPLYVAKGLLPPPEGSAG
ncbi:MAG TPA: MFS transporter, partial [Kofleriaceae bacterium]|nr:MFS transporter [Kofleriaceae bacterium]